MREIKFRAWDYQKNCITTSIGHLDLFKAFANKSKRYKIMQHIGLKDKNGVEIYEGDIIEIKNVWTNGVGKWSHMIGEVVYFECEFQVKDINDNYLSLHRYKSRNEVIGNIHENSELLKD